jgi:hypothetical protein
MAPLGTLRYLYVGSSDPAADIAYWRDVVGANVEWDYREFGTRVAGLRVADGPLWIVAGHRAGKGVLPVFVVPSLTRAEKTLRARGWSPHEGPVEIPDGPCYLFRDASGNEVALVGDERPGAEQHLQAGMREE